MKTTFTVVAALALVALTGCGGPEHDTFGTCLSWATAAHPDVSAVELCTAMSLNDSESFVDLFGAK